jgi:hypothetical protein
MRLTLRTLLALRDGLLQGPERDDLVAKVTASTVAPRLIERIAELGTRADLPAPDADPNTVAEFLDNVLAGDRLEAFERACLESETHLAEAADCHTLLAELVRDSSVSPPIDVATVERLLDVIRQRAPQAQDASLGDDAIAIGDIMREAKAAALRPAAPSGKQPARASLGAWLSVGAAIVLLLVLGGLLMQSIWAPSGRSRQVAAREQPEIEPESPAVSEPSADAPRNDPPEPPVAEPRDEAIAATESAPRTVESDPPDAPPPPSIEEPASPFPPQGDAAVIPLPVMEADGAESTDGLPLSEPSPPVAGQPQAVPGNAPELVSGGPLLHRVATGNDSEWGAVFAGSTLASTEDFIVPWHCYPQIVRGNLSLRLLPGTRGAMTVDRDGTFRIEIVFGQAVVWSEAASASVGITAGGMSGVLTLGPRQPVGIDVQLTRARGEDPAVVPPGMHVEVVATGGGRFRQTERDGGAPGAPLAGLEIDQPLPPRGGLVWDAVAPGAARFMPLPQELAWMKLTGPPRIVDRHASEALAAALGVDQPVAESLRRFSDSRRVEERMAAAATLGLLGDFDAIVEALCDESPSRRLRESEWAAFEAMTVPLALARGANAAAALRQSFAKKGPPGRVAELTLLARGLSAEEFAAGGGEGMVKALEDSSLVIRRYALKNLVSLLPDPAEATRDYRPDRSMRLNDKGLVWWRGRVASGLGVADADAASKP